MTDNHNEDNPYFRNKKKLLSNLFLSTFYYYRGRRYHEGDEAWIRGIKFRLVGKDERYSSGYREEGPDRSYWVSTGDDYTERVYEWIPIKASTLNNGEGVSK